MNKLLAIICILFLYACEPTSAEFDKELEYTNGTLYIKPNQSIVSTAYYGNTNVLVLTVYDSDSNEYYIYKVRYGNRITNVLKVIVNDNK